MTDIILETSDAAQDTYPLLPLRGMLVFPFMITPLDVGREKSIRALEEAMTQDRQLILAVQRSAETSEPEADDIQEIGVMAEIKQLLKMPEGQLRVLVEGLYRVKIEEFVDTDPCFHVRVNEIIETEGIDGTIIGPYDLSGSLGFPGEYDKENIKDLLEKFKLICKNKKKSMGFHVIDPEVKKLKEKIDEGYNFLAFSTDFLFMGENAKKEMDKINNRND